MSNSRMLTLQQSSLLDGTNGSWLESLYESWQRDPDSVDERWHAWFQQLPQVNGKAVDDVLHSELRDEFSKLTGHLRGHRIARVTETRLEFERKQVRVLQLINAYRFRGHQYARTDPLQQNGAAPVSELDLRYHELSDEDLNTVFRTGSLVGPGEGDA